jgi:enoyl-CoA hydratase/carnithine racemase
MEPAVVVQRHGPVAHVVLNRPDKFNAIDLDMLRLLGTTFAEIERDLEIRAVVLRGEGKHFCAGADLESVDPQRASPALFDAFLTEWHGVFDGVEACRVPVIAAVHGFALAGGFELTLVCEVMLVANNARVGDQHAKFGLFPAGGGTQRLVRLIGERRAKWLLYSGEHLNAEQAREFGLAHDVVPLDELVDHADEMAQLLAQRSPSATNAMKRAIRIGAGLEVHDALAAERDIAVDHMTSADATTGIEAFRTRSQPKFPDQEVT